MKKKYKTCTKDGSLHVTLSIPQKFQDKVITREILEIIYKFEHAKTVEEQVVLIPQLTEHIKPPSSHDIEGIIAILTHLLISANPKHPLKKSITRLFTNLNSIAEISKNLSLEIAKQLLQNIVSIEILLETFVYKVEDFDKLNSITNVITSCYENFPTGLTALSYNVSEVFSFLVRALYSFTDRLDHMKSPVVLQRLYQYIHNVTRGLISTTQQFIVSRALYKTYKRGLYDRCLNIINNINISYDTKSNCGIIMVTIASRTKENGYVDLLKFCLEPSIPWCTENEDISKITTDIGVICIFSGILNTIKPKDLVQYNPTSLYLITSRLTEILANSSSNPTIILGVNRTMLLVSRNICQLSIPQLLKLLNILLNFVWMNLDHGIDTVRHIARSIYVNLIKLCVYHRDNGDSSVLDNLVLKTLTLPTQRTCRYRAITTFANEMGAAILMQKEDQLVENLLKQAQNDSMSTYVVTCFESLMRSNLKEIDEDTWIEIWVQPLLAQLGKDAKNAKKSIGLQDLLTTAIRLKPMLLQNILPARSLENPVEFCSLLKCALIARQSGTSCKTEGNVWRGLLQPVILEEAMCHQYDEIRISCLALICESHKSTEIFNNWELSFIIRFLNYNIGTQLPSMRQQILSLMKKIMTRFHESYKLITRNIHKLTLSQKPKNIETLHQQKDFYQEFIVELRSCIFANLFFGANYTRRMLCLEIFKMIRPMYENMIEEWKVEECDALLMCLNDSYENNKVLAVSLLTTCPIELMKLDNENRTRNFLEDAIRLAYSVKPADTVTAAYMLETACFSPIIPSLLQMILCIPHKKHNDYSTEYLMIRYLLTQQRCQLEIAKQNILIAAKTAPLHGILFCIRHLMEKYLPNIQLQYWKPVLAELIKVCLDLDNTVAPVVNNSSPEGHLPMDQVPVNDEFFQNTDETVTAQMLLVCAWRTVKEVSLLLSEICLKGSITSENDFGLITEEQVLTIGEHFTLLLTETRHRGAFEHAYIGFSRLCNRLWQCNSSKLHYLPVQWLEEIIKVISGESNQENKLCETRRSAGLPFMIQAIVASELQSGGNVNFKNCMLMLLDFGTNSKRLETRTHAMNILRALYRHTQLGEMVMPYVADGFMVAIIGFIKPTWAERNSATLLFASLITRMFGVQRNRDVDKISIKNRMTARLFNQRYPSLQPFLLDQLALATETFNNSDKEEVLYPILILLARLYPVCLEEDPHCSLADFIPLIKKCAQGRVLKTRELAAKALSSILYENNKIQVLRQLLLELEEVKNNNYLHGILLQISQILKDSAEADKELDIINVIESTQWIMTINCPIIIALYMQILIQLTVKTVEKKTNYICATLLNDIDNILERDIAIGSSICVRSAFHLKLHLISHVMNSPLDLKCLRTKEIIFKSFSTDNKEIYNFSLNFLLYLLSDDKNSVIIKSWDIPPEEIFLANLYTEKMQDNIYNLIKDDIELFEGLLEPRLFNNDIISSKSFAVLSYFPALLLKIDPIYDDTKIMFILDKSKDICDNNMSCAALCCLRSLMKEDYVKDFRRFADLIYEFSSSSYSVSCRYIVAVMFIENEALLLTSLGSDSISMCIIWQTIMQLLGDSDITVRNTISNLAQTIARNALPVIPERAREILLDYCIESIKAVSDIMCISLLLYWVFDDDEQPDDESIEGQIFEKGEVNPYIEKECLSKLAAKKLPSLFVGREIDFFMTFSTILETNKLQTFWNISEEQKYVLVYYCRKFDSEYKKSNDLSVVKNKMKDIDFWNQAEEGLKWKFFDILDSFLGYDT